MLPIGGRRGYRTRAKHQTTGPYSSDRQVAIVACREVRSITNRSVEVSEALVALIKALLAQLDLGVLRRS